LQSQLKFSVKELACYWSIW